jgi:hypothetical protein
MSSFILKSLGLKRKCIFKFSRTSCGNGLIVAKFHDIKKNHGKIRFAKIFVKKFSRKRKLTTGHKATKTKLVFVEDVRSYEKRSQNALRRV